MKKKVIIAAFTAAAMIGLTACNNKLDVVGDKSIDSFGKVLDITKEQTGENATYGGWSLTSPDGEASFIWSKDNSKSQTYDVLLEVNAQPFLAAGLDVSKLPEGMFTGDKIVVGTDLGSNSPNYEGDATPLASYEQIVKNYRDSVKYHAALDHYGVALTNGNMFEWAKDMTKNDKDIVYVLNPQPFIDAGVDPQNVEGWVFAKVETMDENGKKVELDKFLKPFELDGQQ